VIFGGLAQGSGTQGLVPILILARSLDTGGIERDVSKFSRHLRPHGIEPHVACFNPGGARWQEIRDAGIPVVTIPVTSFKSKSAVKGALMLRQYIAEKGIRLIHAFDVPADMFAVPLARIWKIPVLSSQLCYRDLCNLPTRLIMAVLDRMATGVFVNCEGIARHLSVDWGLASRRIHICHNGFEPAEFHSTGRIRPAALTNASTVIGTVALLRPEKNLSLLVDAFAGVHRIDPDSRLVIVGSGPVRCELDRKASELGIAKACLFQEAVTRPAEWMRAMDIFVLPSSSEGFSNSLLEAMACGCCPVASRVDGTPELVTDEKHGILVESGSVREMTDALCHLVRNPEEIKNKAKAAATFAHENFTMRIASARLSAIYRAIIG
jgi:glycosyltransferase involved in cell wall biosynthesis